MNSTIIWFFTLLVFFLSPSTGTGQSTSFETSMESFITSLKSELNLSIGIGMAVVKGNETIYAHYSGFANVEEQRYVDEETHFYIASSTKSFTALAALMLDHKGVLPLNSTLDEYFPALVENPSLHADKITLKDLLIHTSGIENELLSFKKAYLGNYTNEELFGFLDYATTPNEVGYGNFEYTNTGYNIYNLILLKVLNKDWKTVVREEVLTPLGMNHTLTDMSTLEKLKWKDFEPYSTEYPSGKMKRLPLKKSDAIMHAAGGLFSTPSDMARFLKVQLNLGRLDGKQLFPENVIRESQNVQAKQNTTFIDLERFGYGYGWNLALTESKDTLIHHFGGFTGTHAEVSFMPKEDLGVTIFANDNAMGMGLSYLIASYAFDLAKGKDREGLDELYKQKIEYLRSYFEQQELDYQESLKEIKNRKWMLTFEKSKYAGNYHNDFLGTLTIKNTEDKGLTAHIGLLHSPSLTPFEETDCMRAELIPGQGRILQFIIENNHVTGVMNSGMLFQKIE